VYDHTPQRLSIAFAACCIVAISVSNIAGQGVTLRGVGSINESMAGAGTALPLSASGAIHWNPASIAEFDHHQAEMGLSLIYPDTRVSTTVGPFSGSSRSESGVCPIPTMSLVLKGQNPRITYGIGAFAIAGYRLNYDASTTNPVLMPQGSLGALPTFGRVNTESEFFQIVPTIAYTVNDSWSIGFAPTMTIARLGIEPMLASPPGAAGYPLGSGTRYHFGGGGQIGVYFKPNQQFAAGLTFKSEQYFEDFRFKSQDNATGAPVDSTFDLEYPMIISLGTSYRLSPQTVIASDIRYFDYGQADGFGSAGLKPDGSLLGLSWSSVMAVATGISHDVNDRLTVRCGYVWNESPIDSGNAFFNTAAPLNVQNLVSLGCSIRVHPNMTLSTAYLHAFDQKTSGLYAGLPGTDVTLRTAAYLLSAGVTIDF
jgi:long-chain fatty acid transport protein